MSIERMVVSADGTKIYTRAFGQGDVTVVLCDGLGCTGFIWTYLEPFLAEHCRVVHWNYRGHGSSETPPLNAMTVEALCEDLHAVMEGHDIERAVLMGHSMGTQVLLEYALAHPERVAALVPMCGSYGQPLQTFHDNNVADALFPYLYRMVSRYQGASSALWRRILRSRVVFEFGLRFEVNSTLLRADDFRPYFEHLAGIDPAVFCALLDSLRHHTVESRLHNIDAPALVVAGERDTFTPGWLSRRMAQLLPNAELLVVRGGSHVTPLEAPELLEFRLDRFFQALGLSTGHRKVRKKRVSAHKAKKGRSVRRVRGTIPVVN